MKAIVTVFLFLAGLSGSVAYAADTVKITSFYYLETGANRTPAAELCGVLAQPTGKPEMVKVTVDPKGKQPGIYNTWAGKDGKFCTVLATYTGAADAELAE